DILVVAPIGPRVLADRNAEPHTAITDRARERTWGKDPLLVEHTVIRQIDLEAERRDAAAGEKRIGVMELAVLDPRRANQRGRSAVGGVSGERLDRRAAGGLKCRLEHKVFRRIAGDKQFGKRDQIGVIARRRSARFTRAFQITGNVADRGIKLRHGNSETIGRPLIHDQALTPERPVRQPGSGAAALWVNERNDSFKARPRSQTAWSWA